MHFKEPVVFVLLSFVVCGTSAMDIDSDAGGFDELRAILLGTPTLAVAIPFSSRAHEESDEYDDLAESEGADPGYQNMGEDPDTSYQTRDSEIFEMDLENKVNSKDDQLHEAVARKARHLLTASIQACRRRAYSADSVFAKEVVADAQVANLFEGSGD